MFVQIYTHTHVYILCDAQETKIAPPMTVAVVLKLQLRFSAINVLDSRRACGNGAGPPTHTRLLNGGRHGKIPPSSRQRESIKGSILRSQGWGGSQGICDNRCCVFCSHTALWPHSQLLLTGRRDPRYSGNLQHITSHPHFHTHAHPHSLTTCFTTDWFYQSVIAVLPAWWLLGNCRSAVYTRLQKCDVHRGKVQFTLWKSAFYWLRMECICTVWMPEAPICTTHRVKIYREHTGHVIAFFCGEPARSAFMKADSLIALVCKNQHALYVIWFKHPVITV